MKIFINRESKLAQLENQYAADSGILVQEILLGVK